MLTLMFLDVVGAEQPSVFAPLQNEHGLLDRLLVKDQLHDLIDCFADIHKV